MAKIFFYTFRTNKFVAELENSLNQKMYVADKPAKDFSKLKAEIEVSGARYVVGIGMTKGTSRFEEEAHNRFGANIIDIKNSSTKLKLSVPGGLGFDSGKGMTFGFCNYVAFRLSNELKGIDNSFIHLNPDDIRKVQTLAR
jgi:hypothetical protein